MAGTCGHPLPQAVKPRGEYDFVEPGSLGEVLERLADRPQDTVVLAGGTDLLRNLSHGQSRPSLVVSIGRIPELSGISETDDGLVVGARTTMRELAADPKIIEWYPCLSAAAAQVGSPQVRNRATIGGNLCNASPCADTAGPVHVYDAEAVLRSARGERRVPVAAFMAGPGQTILEPDEVLVSIVLPRPPARTGSSFVSIGHRRALEITVVSATARVTLAADTDEFEVVRVCLGSVAPTPLLSRSVEERLSGRILGDEDIAAAAQAAATDCSPIDDLRAGASYRRSMTEVLTRRVLERSLAMARARGEAS